MIIEQTIDIPVDRRLTIEVPREVPAGRTLLTFTPQSEERGTGYNPQENAIQGWQDGFDRLDDEEVWRRIEELKRSERPRPQTVEEAIKQAGEQAAQPGRIPLSSYFGIMKDHPLTQSGVEYQRSIRDEWD